MMIVLATTVACAGASLVAVQFLPSTYRAAIEMSGGPDLARRWENTSRSKLAEAGLLVASAVPNQTDPWTKLGTRMIGWIEGQEWILPHAPRDDVGLTASANNKLVVWTDADDAATARARVDAVANHIAALEDTVAMTSSEARLKEALSSSKPSASRDAGVASLRQQLANARVRAADAGSKRDAFAQTKVAQALSDDEQIDDRLRLATDRRADLQTEIAVLERAAAQARKGSATFAEGEIAPVDGLFDFQRVVRQRQELGMSVAAMSRTLLEDHPRMVIAKLRLQDIEQEFMKATNRVEQALAERGARLRDQARQAEQDIEGLNTRRAELAATNIEAERLARASEFETAIVERLNVALQATDAAQPEPPAGTISDPQQVKSSSVPSSTRRVILPIEERKPPAWPIVLGASLLGLVVSTGAVAAAGRRPRRMPGPVKSHPATAKARYGQALRKENPTPVSEAIAGLEIAAVDDVIDAIISSGISRAMLASPSTAPQRPLSVDIVRRLALRGQAAALVDLSEEQAAARAMGAAPDAVGLTDLIEGDSTFATIARRDFATKADIVPGGRNAPTSRLDTSAERRNVLDFIERSYETLLVDCGRMKPDIIRDLMDADAALLVAVHGCTPAEMEIAIRDLRQAGLNDMILVGESRSLL